MLPLRLRWTVTRSVRPAASGWSHRTRCACRRPTSRPSDPGRPPVARTIAVADESGVPDGRCGFRQSGRFRSSGGPSHVLRGVRPDGPTFPAGHRRDRPDVRFRQYPGARVWPRRCPPLVLLHAYQASSAEWFALTGPLSHARRIYAVDLVGDAGRSTAGPRSVATPADLVEYLDSVLDGLGLTSSELCGHFRGLDRADLWHQSTHAG